MGGRQTDGIYLIRKSYWSFENEPNRRPSDCHAAARIAIGLGPQFFFIVLSTIAGKETAIKKLLAEDLAELTIWTSQVPQGEGLKALRPGHMQTFNASMQASDAAKFGGAIKQYNFAGDANLNDDAADLISASENHAYPNEWYVPNDGDMFANGAYRTLRYAAKIKVDMVTQNAPSGYALPAYPVIDVLTPTSTPQDNDLAVTVESAKHPNGLFVGQMDRDTPPSSPATSATAS